jgi:hypothetical protein
MDNTVPVVMTTKKVEAMIGQLDRLIGKAEARVGELDTRTLRALVALQQQRSKLRLLAIARRIERQNQVVSLERWRYGFDAPKGADAPRLPRPRPSECDPAARPATLSPPALVRG